MPARHLKGPEGLSSYGFLLTGHMGRRLESAPALRKVTPGGGSIRLVGVSQNNLKKISLEIELETLTVVSGVSGSGKSSLAFDTLYAEGQRRYVETFSPYVRQFFERLPPPAAERIENIPAAVAIQSATVKGSRSTVGTLTAVTDYLKLVFSRAATAHCPQCDRPIRPETAADVARYLESVDGTVLVVAPVDLGGFDAPEIILNALRSQGFTRFLRNGHVVRLEELKPEDVQTGCLRIVVDRLRSGSGSRARRIESVETAFTLGRDTVEIVKQDGTRRTFKRRAVCPVCGLSLPAPTPGLFSFNSPLGACPACNGFGNIIDIDPTLVVPVPEATLEQGAIKPLNSQRGRRFRRRLLQFCREKGIPTNVPFAQLSEEAKKLIFEGDGSFPGVSGFFKKLEKKKYKLHVRVFLSRYRGYRTCPECGGSRLRAEARAWKVEGLTLPEILDMPVSGSAPLFERLAQREDPALQVLAGEIASRLRYLCDVGLGYLSLSRQSRTLSGGELERVNLTTALGTRLVGTLFVLDEPSIGLHPRDGERLLGILHKIRDQGNTVVVVEHDPLIVRSADRLIDLGPGAGHEGGRIVAEGTPAQVARCAQSRTGAFLRGELTIPVPKERRGCDCGEIRIVGASCHNLKGITCGFPLGRFICVTGPSGSGKSTLLVDTLWRAFMARIGQPAGQVGPCEAIEGLDLVDEIVLVDQAPPGKTARANPATYCGVLDPIRKVFAATRAAESAGMTARYFSFNSPLGACRACGGEGFERVEMQFLPDVLIPCEDCEGRRYAGEVLEIRYRGHTIADVLDLTCREAWDLFADEDEVKRALQPLLTLGLGYLKLGQPLTTLSGGELQRLKLIRRFSASKSEKLFFILDEPSTGLHVADLPALLSLFGELVDRGHTVCVIEHNMEIVKCADYVIDLGPGSGEEGGRVVACGTPEEVASCKASPTAPYLKAALEGRPIEKRRAVRPRRAGRRPAHIVIRGAREHNLKNLSVAIPRGKLTVVTGLSGAGKSTLVYDILFAEGQRRYLDCLSPYARQFVEQLKRPDVDHVEGIPPTVAIEQHTSAGAARSTVGTVTEIYPFLRLLYARVGVQYCPQCGVPVEARGQEAILKEVRRLAAEGGFLLVPSVRGRRGYHTDLFDRALREGFEYARVDGEIIPIEPGMQLTRYVPHDIDLVAYRFGRVPRDLRQRLDRALELGKGTVIFLTGGGREVVLSRERACPRCHRGYERPEPRNFSFLSRWGRCPVCEGTGEEDGKVCPECGGSRLALPWREVRVDKWRLGDLTSLEVSVLGEVLKKLKIKPRLKPIAEPIVREVCERIRFLKQVGLGYLTLNRSVPSLSTGEARRIRLAAQLGSNLNGVCYLLDEPTIGLHPRDNEQLLCALEQLRDRGNTVVVVEHDDATIRRADYVVELGPGPGKLGGQLVAAGPPIALLSEPRSPTGRYLARGKGALTGKAPRKNAPGLIVRGACANNLKRVTARFPLGCMIAVTGVSGAGKSSLIRDTVVPGLRGALGKRCRAEGPFSALLGAEHFSRVVEVDQSPIGRTPRSVPATYIGLWTEIRKTFAQLPEARVRGLKERHFSFNTPEGACERCGGQGRIKVEMHFLPDVYVECDACGGNRFKPEVLMVTLGGKHVGDVLRMSVSEALAFFKPYPRIHRMLEFLEAIGLGYLELGQPSTTLSGGEAQRIKLARELALEGRGRTFYVLDEPTTGLHMEDVGRLVEVLRRLSGRGNVVCIIEHNLELISACDYIIDLGPEGGKEGGRILYQGSVEGILNHKEKSHTARYLASFLEGGL